VCPRTALAGLDLGPPCSMCWRWRWCCGMTTVPEDRLGRWEGRQGRALRAPKRRGWWRAWWRILTVSVLVLKTIDALILADNPYTYSLAGTLPLYPLISSGTPSSCIRAVSQQSRGRKTTTQVGGVPSRPLATHDTRLLVDLRAAYSIRTCMTSPANRYTCSKLGECLGAKASKCSGWASLLCIIQNVACVVPDAFWGD